MDDIWTNPAMLDALSAAFSDADEANRKVMGGHQYYVWGCFLPALERHGLKIVRTGTPDTVSVHVSLESGAKPETVAALGAAIHGAIQKAREIAVGPSAPSELRGPAAQGSRFRALVAQETIQEGDEFLEDDMVTWTPVPAHYMGCQYGAMFVPMRRPLEARSAPEPKATAEAASAGAAPSAATRLASYLLPKGHPLRQPRPVEGDKGPGGAG